MIADQTLEAQYQAKAPRYPELRGKVAVVTGGAKGIGLGIAARLVREGMRVVLGDIDAPALSAATRSLQQLGASVLPVEGDLSRDEGVRNLFDQAGAAFGTVDLLVNNAADLHRTRLLDEHAELLELQLATNIRGPYLCSIQAARLMREHGGGNIVHISSVGGSRAHWPGFPYDVTKGAIDAMTRAMAIDLAEYNIRVNAIGPGATLTRPVPPEKIADIREIAQRIPLGRFGQVSEIGAVVAFLASTEASYLTGQVIYVDGGITAQLSPPGQKI